MKHGLRSKIVKERCTKAGKGRKRKSSAYNLLGDAKKELPKSRICEGCPFGPREYTKKLGRDHYETIEIPPKCRYYDLKRRKCKITAKVFAKKFNEFRKFQPLERMKALAAFLERQIVSRAITDEMDGRVSKVQIDAMDKLKKIYQSIMEHDTVTDTQGYEKDIREIIIETPTETRTIRKTKVRKKKEESETTSTEEVEEEEEEKEKEVEYA